jgi:hypothetical protein
VAFIGINQRELPNNGLHGYDGIYTKLVTYATEFIKSKEISKIYFLVTTLEDGCQQAPFNEWLKIHNFKQLSGHGTLACYGPPTETQQEPANDAPPSDPTLKADQQEPAEKGLIGSGWADTRPADRQKSPGPGGEGNDPRNNNVPEQGRPAPRVTGGNPQGVDKGLPTGGELGKSRWALQTDSMTPGGGSANVPQAGREIGTTAGNRSGRQRESGMRESGRRGGIKLNPAVRDGL